MEELQDEVEILLDFLAEDESVHEELVEQCQNLIRWWPVTRWPCSCQNLMTIIMRFWKSIQDRVVPRLRIWGDMLLRMYTRYGNAKGFKVEVLDYQAGDEAGIKSVTLSLKDLMPMVFSSQKWGYTVWCEFHHLTLLNVAIPLSHL